MMKLWHVATSIGLVTVVGCSGTQAQPMPDLAPAENDLGVMGQHGRVIDYFTSQPQAGFTVTDGTNTTTTDADGVFVLPAPMGVLLAPVVTGPAYSTLQLPTAMATATDVDRGAIPIPSSQTYATEQQILTNDTSKGLVQVTLLKTGACASVEGGTLTVNSPAGAMVTYFDKSGLPLAPSFTDTTNQRPAAVIYDVPAGATLDVTIHHPSCTVAPDATFGGAKFTGETRTLATEPGDNNASLVIVLQ